MRTSATRDPATIISGDAKLFSGMKKESRRLLSCGIKSRAFKPVGTKVSNSTEYFLTSEFSLSIFLRSLGATSMRSPEGRTRKIVGISPSSRSSPRDAALLWRRHAYRLVRGVAASESSSFQSGTESKPVCRSRGVFSSSKGDEDLSFWKGELSKVMTQSSNVNMRYL